MKAIPIARAKRGAAVLICRKCLKRVRQGKNLPRALKSELRGLAAEAGAKKPRVVMTSCFGICPKRAVVATDGIHLARGEFLLIDGESVKSAAKALSGGERSTFPQGELRAAE